MLNDGKFGICTIWFRGLKLKTRETIQNQIQKISHRNLEKGMANQLARKLKLDSEEKSAQQ